MLDGDSGDESGNSGPVESRPDQEAMMETLREMFPGAGKRRLRHAVKSATSVENAVDIIVASQKPGAAALEDSNDDDDDDYDDDEEQGDGDGNDEDGDSSTASGFARKRSTHAKSVSTGWIATKPPSARDEKKKKKSACGKGGRARQRACLHVCLLLSLLILRDCAQPLGSCRSVMRVLRVAL